YHFLAHQASADRTDRAGRDLALDAPIAGLSADEQAIVASVAAFQREKLRPNREPAFLRLGERDQHVALSLAAILRIADLLDTQRIPPLLLQPHHHDWTL